jgi:hypothetical protein
MPFTSYALFKGIRSHRIDSPSVLRHLASGRPNACNLCHVDRSLSWTAAALEQWYGKPTPPAAAEHGERSAIVEAALAGDAAERAIAAYALGRPEALAAAGENLPVAALAELLADPYSAVRLVALRALRAQPGLEAFDYDFLAEPAQRQAAVRRARELTHGRGPDQATIAALSARRDDRPIVISE